MTRMLIVIQQFFVDVKEKLARIIVLSVVSFGSSESPKKDAIHIMFPMI